MSESDGSHPCGVGIRGVAMAVDSVVWLLLFMVAVTAVGAATGQVETTAEGINTDLEGTAALIGLGCWLTLSIGYHALFEWRFGKTAGKYLVGIRVVATDGSPPSLPASLLRNVARLVDWLPALYGVGVLALLLSDRHRRLGDRLGGTTVVRS